MTKQELEKLLSVNNAAVVASAGHGKTEMLVEMVEYTSGKQLLLTHTHAGVDAIQKRLNNRNIPKTKYTISTIAAFFIKWGTAYSHTTGIDLSLSPYNSKSETRRYYNQFYEGVKKLFLHEWAGKVLQATYSGIIIDEYQDCLQSHHEVFQILSKYLPVRVFGDPLQGIFSFADQKLVDWNNLGYTVVDVMTAPWRWHKTNPALGQYLSDIRENLLPSLSGLQCSVNIDSCNGSISVVDPLYFNLYSILEELKQYRSVLYITKWESQQRNFCLRYPSLFQLDEKQECEDLYNYAKLFSEHTGTNLLLKIIEFESKCATGVNSELKSYIARLEKGSFDFSRIKKNQEFGQLLIKMQNSDKHDTILCILDWFENNRIFKCYRKELHFEMIRCVKYSRNHDISILEAAGYIRKDPTLQKRYQGFRFLSSRTLLSKGLEFDSVIIDMSVPLSAKEFYVALTRAMKKIYILSPSNHLTLYP